MTTYTSPRTSDRGQEKSGCAPVLPNKHSVCLWRTSVVVKFWCFTPGSQLTFAPVVSRREALAAHFEQRRNSLRSNSRRCFSSASQRLPTPHNQSSAQANQLPFTSIVGSGDLLPLDLPWASEQRRTTLHKIPAATYGAGASMNLQSFSAPRGASLPVLGRRGHGPKRGRRPILEVQAILGCQIK